MSEIDIKKIQEKITQESAFVESLLANISKVIIGQKDMIEKILIAILSNGHILIEGVPGLAKTLTIKAVAESINAEFKRIQFTPDLLPADLLGTNIYNIKTGDFYIHKGPIFTQILLADEINRAPSKVQSALLEAMQEKQVTISNTTFKLEDIFTVLATQNPIEQEGTYPLSEAQIDRFIFKLKVDYPSKDEEKQILKNNSITQKIEIKPVIDIKDILRARECLKEIYVDEKIENYILDIVLATRNPSEYKLSELEGLIEFGASPRASIYLLLTSKARAFLKRRGYVIPEDIRAVVYDVLRHRIIPGYEAEAEGLTSENIISKILAKIPVP